MSRSRWIVASVVVSSLALAGCSSDSNGTLPPPTMRDVGPEAGQMMHCSNLQCLPSAKPGDVVQLAPDMNVRGPLVGPLTVPAGVTLDGDPSIEIVTTGPGAVLIVQTDDESGYPTVVRNVTLRPKRGVGLLVLGNGSFEGHGIQITVDAGIGVVAEGPKQFSLRDSQIRGAEGLDLLRKERFPVLSINKPIIGLALSKLGNVQLKNVTVEHFIGVGALLSQSNGRWEGGRIGEQVGVGLYVHGGQLALENLAVDRNAASSTLFPSLTSFGVVVGGGAQLQSKKLRISQNDGLGLVHAAGTGLHEELLVADNGRIGVSVQATGRVTLQKSSVARNSGVGILARGAASLRVEDSTVSGTKTLPEGRAERLGDGLQIVMPIERLHLARVHFLDNARAACVLHGSAPGPRGSMEISAVSIGGKGAMGLVVQGGMSAWASWDYQVAQSTQGEVPPAAQLAMADTVAIPTLGPLTGSLVGNDQGQVSPSGGVTIQIGAKGLDPGLGP